MSEFIQASQVTVENCAETCRCQSVWIVLRLADDTIASAGACPPEVARAVARDLLRSADIAEGRQVAIEGRLS